MLSLDIIQNCDFTAGAYSAMLFSWWVKVVHLLCDLGDNAFALPAIKIDAGNITLDTVSANEAFYLSYFFSIQLPCCDVEGWNAFIS